MVMNGIRMMVMDKSFDDKVKDKLELNKVNDVVKQLETPPTKDLKIIDLARYKIIFDKEQVVENGIFIIQLL